MYDCTSKLQQKLNRPINCASKLEQKITRVKFEGVALLQYLVVCCTYSCEVGNGPAVKLPSAVVMELGRGGGAVTSCWTLI